MSDAWDDLIHGDRWRSSETLWVEDDTEYSWKQVGELASTIEGVIRDRGAARVVRVQSGSKLGCFAGQLAAWRAHCVAVADHGSLGPSEIDRVRPDLTLAVAVGRTPTVELLQRSKDRLPDTRIPDEVVAVNFTSGSTGSRKAVGVTRGNLLALFGCRGLDVPVSHRLTSGSFATPSYDGWWFDTWRTASMGGAVVCLPDVNEDMFAWPELVTKYRIDSVLLPAAVVATIIEAVPACIADIPWVFSGGEQFQVSTYRRARQAGLQNRFVNLYGPTEATFATHRYELPESLTAAAIPIGKPLDGCHQRLRDLGDRGDRVNLDGHGDLDDHGEQTSDCGELVVAGPLVCLGYLEKGALAHWFRSEDGQSSFRTSDMVRVDDDGDLVFAGRLDSQIKVNGMRVDAAALERQVTGLPYVFDCRVVQNELRTVAFVRADESSTDLASRSQIESVVKRFSPAIRVQLVDRFPVKFGGKVDTTFLMDQHCVTEKGEER